MVEGGRIVLGSLEVRGITSVADVHRVLLVPTAANGLADREAVVDIFRRPLVELGLEVVEHDLDTAGPVGADLAGCDAILCSGGDPYHLLAAARRSGFGDVVRGALARGVAYVGASAGALLAGPSLEPVGAVTPFERPDGFDDRALGLTDIVALPHDDRPDRRAAHAAAQRRHGRAHRMLGVTDDELLVVDPPSSWWLLDQRTGRRVRPAVAADAPAVAATFVEAGRTAWDFVPPDRYAELDPPTAAWTDRIAAAADPAEVLVVEDADGVAGFVWVRWAQDADLPPATGEVGALYTRPRLWGSGAGRRLLTLGLDRLRAMGATTAVLYTEERNARPRRLYERAGWTLDGAARRREFLATPIVELRHRLAL